MLIESFKCLITVRQQFHSAVRYVDQIDEHFDPFVAHDHGSSEVKLLVSLFPHTVSQRHGNVRYLLSLPDGNAGHKADKAVAVEVI